MSDKKEKTILIELTKKEFETIFSCLNEQMACSGGSGISKDDVWSVFQKFYATFEDLEHRLPPLKR